MNPAAPVWVSQQQAASSSTAPAPQYARQSMLDPNSAAFRPKSALQSSRGMTAPQHGAMVGGSVPPGGFTRYGGSLPGSIAQYPMRSEQAYASSPGRGLHPATASYARYHTGGVPLAAASGAIGVSTRDGTVAYYHPGAQVVPPMPHHSSSPAVSGAGGLRYAAKANTHWGTAGPPQNISHQAPPSGVVVYHHSATSSAAPRHPAAVGVSSQSHYTAQGHVASPPQSSSAPSLNSTPSRAPALQEELLFTPSTRDIWSGGAAVSTDRALDSAIEPLVQTNTQESVVASSSAVLSSREEAHLLQLAGVDNGEPDAAWSAAPWSSLIKSEAKTGSDAAEPVDTVQKLLAQLTQESPSKALNTSQEPAHCAKETAIKTPTSSAHRPPAAIGGSPTETGASISRSLAHREAVSQAAAAADDVPTRQVKQVPRSSRGHSRPMQLQVDSAPAAADDVTSPEATSSIRFGTHDDVEVLLRDSKETLRHVKILSFSKQHPDEVAHLFQAWAAKGIPAPDDVFGAYYYYVAKKSGMELCMKHNGRGRAPGVGYGGCDFANRGTNFRCRFHHVCLFCKGQDHGWFDESKCGRYQAFQTELQKLKLSDQDIPDLVDAYDRKALGT